MIQFSLQRSMSRDEMRKLKMDGFMPRVALPLGLRHLPVGLLQSINYGYAQISVFTPSISQLKARLNKSRSSSVPAGLVQQAK
jgi:hypothetical protein